MAEFVEVVNDFSRGDWGNLGAFRAGTLPDGMFKAKNMIVYDDGSIGPRPGLKDRAVTGLPNGAVLGMGYTPFSLGTMDTWLIIGTALYGGSTAFTAATGSLGTAPARRVRHKESTRLLNSNMYFVTDNTGIWRWAPSGHTLTNVSATLDGTDIELYRDRLYVTDVASGSTRIFYSDAADLNTWGALSYFDVGYQLPHQHIFSSRNTLAIITDEYQWVLSGVPESTSTLRRVSQAIPAARHPATTVRDDIWYIPATRSAPVRWVGGIGDEKSFEHLEWATTGFDDFGAAAQIKTDDILFVSTVDTGLLRHNNVWTLLDFETTVSPIISRYSQDEFMLTDGGGASAAAKLFRFVPELNRPGFVGDDEANPGDDSDTPVDADLYLPEWWHPRGWEARVKWVEVDFVSWDTGTTETAHFDIVVEATRPRAVNTTTSGGVTSGTQTFDEAVASSSTSGTERRMRFNFSTAWGRGYQVRFDNVRSVSFRGITVGVEDDKRDSR